MTLRHWLSTVFVLALSVAACDTARESGELADEGEPQRGGTVTLLELADLDKPFPFIETTTTDGEVSDMMYLSLLGSSWTNGRLVFHTSEEDGRAISKSYEFFGPDSASLRFNMRGDLVWSDGTPLTAHDAKWTLETMALPEVASPRQDYMQNVREVVVENDSTLVVHFTKRYPEMLFHTTGVSVAPRHIFEGTDLSQIRNHPAINNPQNGALVVSGPYMIGEWLRGQRAVLVPNPRFEPQPYIQRIVILPIPEQTTRLIELQTGRADVMQQLPFDQLETVRAANPNIRFETRERRIYDYIAYDPGAHPALADPEIRRALGLAIDVQGMIDALQLTEYAERAGGPYSPIFALLHDPVKHAPLPYDTAEAKRILDSKGWVPGPDGVRAKEGRRFSFQITTNAGNQRRADIAQIAQQAWRRVGVDAQIQILESNTFFDRLQKRDFEAAIAGWSVGLAADISDQWRGDNVFNYTSFNDPEVSRLFDLALAQPTEELAAPYWVDASAKIVEQQPYTWLFWMDIVMGVNNRVRNTKVDTYGAYQNIEQWWVVDAAAEAGATQGANGGR
jgi:peptide/nickel transport system substrate-binding protein